MKHLALLLTLPLFAACGPATRMHPLALAADQAACTV